MKYTLAYTYSSICSHLCFLVRLPRILPAHVVVSIGQYLDHYTRFYAFWKDLRGVTIKVLKNRENSLFDFQTYCESFFLMCIVNDLKET